jgi:hypothetical protein
MLKSKSIFTYAIPAVGPAEIFRVFFESVDSMFIATAKVSLTVSTVIEHFAVGVSEKPIPLEVFQLAVFVKLTFAEALAAAAALMGTAKYFASSPKIWKIAPC